jgi:pimeloyl-ACP methyl ester carboxylesterase
MNKDRNHTIFLIHGWGGSKESLKPLANKLSSEFNTITLELPGHGNTQPMEKAWGMNEFSNWLVEKIRENNVKDYSILGHSFGGKTALFAAAFGKINPKNLILIDVSGIKPKNSVKKSILLIFSKILAPLKYIPFIRSLVYKFIVKESDYIKVKGVLKSSFQKIIDEHIDNELQNINIPTIIIWGRNDRETPVWMGEKLHSEIKNSKLKILDGTHGLPIHKPELVSEVIKMSI